MAIAGLAIVVGLAAWLDGGAGRASGSACRPIRGQPERCGAHPVRPTRSVVVRRQYGYEAEIHEVSGWCGGPGGPGHSGILDRHRASVVSCRRSNRCASRSNWSLPPTPCQELRQRHRGHRLDGGRGGRQLGAAAATEARVHDHARTAGGSWLPRGCGGDRRGQRQSHAASLRRSACGVLVSGRRCTDRPEDTMGRAVYHPVAVVVALLVSPGTPLTRRPAPAGRTRPPSAAAGA